MLNPADAKKALATFKATSRKKYGNDIFADSSIIHKINSISTGSAKVDHIIGINGVPMGRLTEINGEKI